MWHPILTMYNDDELFNQLNKLEDELKELFISYAEIKTIKKKIKDIKDELRGRGYEV